MFLLVWVQQSSISFVNFYYNISLFEDDDEDIRSWKESVASAADVSAAADSSSLTKSKKSSSLQSLTKINMDGKLFPHELQEQPNYVSSGEDTRNTRCAYF